MMDGNDDHHAPSSQPISQLLLRSTTPHSATGMQSMSNPVTPDPVPRSSRSRSAPTSIRGSARTSTDASITQFMAPPPLPPLPFTSAAASEMMSRDQQQMQPIATLDEYLATLHQVRARMLAGETAAEHARHLQSTLSQFAAERDQYKHDLLRAQGALAAQDTAHARESRLAAETLVSLKLALSDAAADRDASASDAEVLGVRLHGAIDRAAAAEAEVAQLREQVAAYVAHPPVLPGPPSPVPLPPTGPSDEDDGDEMQKQQLAELQRALTAERARAVAAERNAVQVAQDLGAAKHELAMAHARAEAAEHEASLLSSAMLAKSDMHHDAMRVLEREAVDLRRKLQLGVAVAAKAAAEDEDAPPLPPLPPPEHLVADLADARSLVKSLQQGMDGAQARTADLEAQLQEARQEIEVVSCERDLLVHETRDLVDTIKEWKQRAVEAQRQLQELELQQQDGARAESLASHISIHDTNLGAGAPGPGVPTALDNPLIAELHMERQKLQDALAASRVTSFAQVSALQSQTQALESDLAAADDRIHELEDLVDELHSDLEALRASRRDRSPRSISSRASTPAASPPMDAATNCGPEGQGMRRSASMQGEMEHLMRQLRSVDTTRARLEDQCAVLSGQSRAAAERAAAATADRDAAQRRVSELLDVCKDLEQQITDGAKQFDAARRECEAAHRLAMERQARMEDLERQCADAAVRVTTARDLVAAMADKRGSDAAAKDDGEDVAAEMERLQDEVRLLNTELDQTSNLLDEAKRTAERALQRATRAEQDKADMTRELVEMQTKVQAADEAAELVARARDTEAALGQVRTARDALAVRLEESESKVTRLNSEYVGAMGRVADLAAENGQLAESLAAAQHDLAETRAELEPLKVEHEQLAAEYSEVAEQAAAAMAARDDAVQAAKTSDAAAKDAERQRLLTQSTLVETQNQLTLANRQIDRSRTASVGSPGPHGRRPGTPSTPGRSTASGGDRATAAQLQVDLTARDRQLDELRTQYADVVQQFHAISAKSAAMKRAVSAKLAALDARERDTQSVQLEFVQLEKNYLGQIEELHATISDLREALQEAHAAIDAKEGAIAELEHMLDAQQTQVIPAHIARRVSGRYFAADDHQQEDDGDDEDPATEPTSAMGQVRLAMQSQETEHLRDEIHERELRLVSAHGQIEKLATELLCVCAERDDLVAKLRAAQAAAATEAANKELQQAQLRNHATATSLGPTALDSIMTMDDDDQVAPQFFTTAPAAAATSGSSAAAAAEAASSLQHVAHALVELKREYTVRVAERDELQRKLAQERKYFAKRSADADSERAQLLDHLVALEDKAATVAANAAASQSGVAAEERARAQRYKGKYVREAVHRAALVQQKIYLTSMLRTYRQGEETSWRLIQDLGISRPTRGSTPLHPRTRLRMGILAVVAAIRLTRLAFKARAQLQQLQRSEGSATPTPKGTSLPLQSSSSAPSTSRALAARQRTDSNVSSGGGAVPASTEQLGSRRRMSGSK